MSRITRLPNATRQGPWRRSVRTLVRAIADRGTQAGAAPRSAVAPEGLHEFRGPLVRPCGYDQCGRPRSAANPGGKCDPRAGDCRPTSHRCLIGDQRVRLDRPPADRVPRCARVDRADPAEGCAVLVGLLLVATGVALSFTPPPRSSPRPFRRHTPTWPPASPCDDPGRGGTGDGGRHGDRHLSRGLRCRCRCSGLVLSGVHGPPQWWPSPLPRSTRLSRRRRGSERTPCDYFPAWEVTPDSSDVHARQRTPRDRRSRRIGPRSHSVSQAAPGWRSRRPRYDEGPDPRFRRSGPIHRWWAILGLNQ
jgi:hypothetical protein